VTNLKELFELVNDMYCRSVVNDVAEGGQRLVRSRLWQGRGWRPNGRTRRRGGGENKKDHYPTRVCRRKGLGVVIEGEEDSHLAFAGERGSWKPASERGGWHS
jgi:hypothetical protein